MFDCFDHAVAQPDRALLLQTQIDVLSNRHHQVLAVVEPYLRNFLQCTRLSSQKKRGR